MKYIFAIILGIFGVAICSFWANSEWKKYKTGEGYFYTDHSRAVALIFVCLALALAGVMALIEKV